MTKAIFCKNCGEMTVVREEDAQPFLGALQCTKCGIELLGGWVENEGAPEAPAPEGAPTGKQAASQQAGELGAVSTVPRTHLTKSAVSVIRKCPNCKLELDKAYASVSGSRRCPFCGFDHTDNLRAHAIEKARAKAVFEHVSLREMFSFWDVLHKGDNRLFIALGLFILGLAPLAYKKLAADVPVRSFFWFFTSYFAAIWGIILYHFIKPRRIFPPVAIWIGSITLFVTGSGLVFSQILNIMEPIYALLQSDVLMERLAGYTFGVGVTEEVVKALPVILFIRLKFIRDPESACFYGVISGLAFSVAEGVSYSYRYAFGLISNQISIDTFLLAHFIRYITLPLAHATLSGLACYFIGLATYAPRSRWRLSILGIFFSALLHGVYNTFSGGFLGLIILGLLVWLFCLFVFKSTDLAERMDMIESAARLREKGSASP